MWQQIVKWRMSSLMKLRCSSVLTFNVCNILLVYLFVFSLHHNTQRIHWNKIPRRRARQALFMLNGCFCNQLRDRMFSLPRGCNLIFQHTVRWACQSRGRTKLHFWPSRNADFCIEGLTTCAFYTNPSRLLVYRWQRHFWRFWDIKQALQGKFICVKEKL